MKRLEGMILTEVIFSFDTEDYTNPGSDDAILRLAEVLRAEGIRASFNMVAALAEALVERGRQDILAELRFHEINYHTYRHSWHPVPVEYSDGPDWDAPYDRLVSEEAPGIEVVKRIFQREHLFAAVPPGNCLTAQGLYAYAAMGLPVCVSSFLMRETGGKSIGYCNGIYVENNEFWDSLLLKEGLDGALKRIDTWRTWNRLVICMHPNLILYKTFWDKLNLDGANQVAWGQWRLAERRSPEVIEQFFQDFRQAVRALKGDPDFRFITFQEVVASQPRRKNLSKEALIELLEAVRQKFFYASHAGNSYSLAEMFGACAYFLNGGSGIYQLEPLRGPVDEPAGIIETAQISTADLRQAASRLAGELSVPSQVEAGNVRIGPRDFLEAARQVLHGDDPVVLRPQPQMPDITSFYHMDEAQLAGTWLYSPDFKDEWVSRRLKWQAWTIHL
jgi:peptidoglycan/xylan/chitin deacetylase (PgdA/CDA1 family)